MKYDEDLEKNANALLEKIQNHNFSFFSSQVVANKTLFRFLQLKQKMFAVFFKIIAKTFFTSKLVWYLELSTQKIWKFSKFISIQCTRAPCISRQKFHAERRIFKHFQKSAKLSVTAVTRCRQRVKGTVARDFPPPFFHQKYPSWTLIHIISFFSNLVSNSWSYYN